jgi:hypothetical protein
MSQRQGTWVRPNTDVCTLTFQSSCAASEADGSAAVAATEPVTFCLTAGVKGKVLSGNGRLLEDPSPLSLRPHDNGHLLILALQGKEAQRHVEGSISEVEFLRMRGLPAHVLRAGLLDDSDFERAMGAAERMNYTASAASAGAASNDVAATTGHQALAASAGDAQRNEIIARSGNGIDPVHDTASVRP